MSEQSNSLHQYRPTGIMTTGQLFSQATPGTLIPWQILFTRVCHVLFLRLLSSLRSICYSSFHIIIPFNQQFFSPIWIKRCCFHFGVLLPLNKLRRLAHLRLDTTLVLGESTFGIGKAQASHIHAWWYCQTSDRGRLPFATRYHICHRVMNSVPNPTGTLVTSATVKVKGWWGWAVHGQRWLMGVISTISIDVVVISLLLVV